MSLRRTTDRILLHCHAGCEAGDVLAELGLTWGDLHDSDTAPPRVRIWRPKPSPLGDPVHLLQRIAEEHAREEDPGYWERRAREFDQVPDPETAAACRQRAALLRWEAGGQLVSPKMPRPW